MENEDQSIDELQQYFLTLLTQIYIWSEKLDKYIIDEKKHLQININKYTGISQISNLGFKPISSKYDKITPALLTELKKDHPEEFNTIAKHIGFILSKSQNEMFLSLFEETFPSITWSSLFIITISYLEHCLVQTGEYLSSNNKLKLNDLSGNSIYEKFKNYCSKVLAIEYDFDSILWCNIINHKNVRNIVVHNNGVLDNDEKIKKIENIIKNSNTSLKINENRIIMDKEYLNEVIFNIQNWMEEFFTKIKRI